jgi:hypothetical protein
MSSSDKETELKSLKEEERLLAEQLSFFRRELYIASSPGVQFELKKKIEESQQRLDEIKSKITILEKPPNTSSVPKGPSYVYTIPLQNKKLFVIFVCTILAIVAYNSTWLAVHVSLYYQTYNAAMVMAEQQTPHQPNESQQNVLGQFNKFAEREMLKQQKYQELYPKVWEETIAKHRFQTWAWIGSINFVILASLTSILLINNYLIRSKLFNAVNFVVAATFTALVFFTFKVPAVFFPRFFLSVFFTIIVLLPFGFFLYKLVEAFSYSQELQEHFSEQKVYLFLSFVGGTSIGLGVFSGLLLHNVAAIIFLNGMALAVLLTLSKRLYDFVREDSIDWHWRSRFWRRY